MKGTDSKQEAARPIASLLSKSEKAMQKLATGTWQHAMLQNNIQALQIAAELMSGQPVKPDRFSPDELQDAHQALASMIDKTEKAQPRFPSGTSQHTLLRNRLQALQTADVLIRKQIRMKK